MEDKELCCICLDYTIDFDIIDFDIGDFDIGDLDIGDLDIGDFVITDFSKGNSINYKILNCCNNTIHKYCLMILFLYGYEDCPLCRCNICINDYFTVDDFHDFYLYSKTSKVGNESKTLNELLWKLCNSNYYYYFKTIFNTYVVRRQGICTLPMTFCQSSHLNVLKVICIMLIIMLIILCFYFLLFYICTLLY